MKTFLIGSAALILTQLSAANAQSNDGSFNSIVRGCQSAISESAHGNPLIAIDEGKCFGLVEGVIIASPRICHPSGASLGQAIRVVLQYSNRIPARWHEQRAKIIEEALASAWPCR